MKTGKPVDAKVMARALISWLNKYKNYNHLIGYILNFKFKFSNSTFVFLCWPLFVEKSIFKTHQRFCFLCFHSRWRFFWFHEGIEITKNLFNLTENNFGTCLNFGEILFAGRKRAVPGRQYRSILPARVANQNTEFAAYCPFADLSYSSNGKQTAGRLLISSSFTLF